MTHLELENFHPEHPISLINDDDNIREFPTDALGPLKSIVETVQGMTLAPIAIPGQSALAIASLAVQGFSNVSTLGGVRPLSLYNLTIARSGERKSACDSILLAPLRRFEIDQSRQREKDMSKWKVKHALWESELKQIQKETANNFDIQKDEIPIGHLDRIKNEPKMPPITDRIVSEPTFEGLTKLFAMGQPSLGMFSDEGGQFLGGFAMQVENKQKTMAALNDLWQGNPIRRTRQGDTLGTYYNKRLAIHLMIQPDVAHKLISDKFANGIGFLSRFLVCDPPSTIGTRLQANVRFNEPELESYSDHLLNILDRDLPQKNCSDIGLMKTLKMSEASRKLLVNFADSVEKDQCCGGKFEEVIPTASKATEQASRIAGVLTLWADLNAIEIEAQIMSNAIELAKYYLSEALRLTGQSKLSDDKFNAEKLRIWLLQNWKYPEITLREVLQYGPNNHRDKKRAKASIQLLEENGWLISFPTGTVIRGTQRKEAWQIVGFEIQE